MNIVALKPEHWSSVRKIYQEGIDTGLATFETIAPAMEIWDKKFELQCRLVGLLNNEVIGWAALQKVSKREVYKGVGEVSVYILQEHGNKGYGYRLLKSLVEASEVQGYWHLTASIFPENIASIRIHKKCGFEELGIRKRIGRRNGVWKDTLILDRRSQNIEWY